MLGGVFEIQALPQVSADTPLPKAYASGRAALYQILRQAGATGRVWLPSFICSSVTEAIRKAGCTPQFYGLSPAFQAQGIAAVRGDIILVVNYFGMVDCAGQIQALREEFPGVTLIEDDVQAYFAFAAGSRADYSFTSLRKTFAVPDGGVVKPALLPAAVENGFSSLAAEGAVMKARRAAGTDDAVYLELLERAEHQIDAEYDCSMSRIGDALWKGIDVEEVARKRRENALHLLEGLRRLGVEPLLYPDNSQVPLFLPLSLPHSDKVRRYLFSHEVFCPVHWPGSDLQGRELSLIVDQRYGLADMDRMLNLLNDIL